MNRYKKPEHVKQREAQEIKRRFENYLGKPKKAETKSPKSWTLLLIVGVLVYAVWRQMHR